MSRATRLPSTMTATTHFTEADSARVNRLIATTSIGRAMTLLSVSKQVFEAARDCGRVWKTTRDKVVARLDELDSEAKGAAE